MDKKISTILQLKPSTRSFLVALLCCSFGACATGPDPVQKAADEHASAETLHIWTKCVGDAAREYASGDATVNELANASLGKCDGAFGDYRQASEQQIFRNVTRYEVRENLTPKFDQMLLEAQDAMRLKVTQIIVETRRNNGVMAKSLAAQKDYFDCLKEYVFKRLESSIEPEQLLDKAEKNCADLDATNKAEYSKMLVAVGTKESKDEEWVAQRTTENHKKYRDKFRAKLISIVNEHRNNLKK